MPMNALPPPPPSTPCCGPISRRNFLADFGIRFADLAFVRSMWTTDNDHAAENQMHTGRHRLDEIQPSIGAWVHYGLGSLNDNLPSYIVLGGPTRADTRTSIGSYYLGPRHAGVPLALGKEPLPHARRSPDILAEEQTNEYELIGKLNNLAAVEYPEDAALKARIKTYELAFRMQTSVPAALDLQKGETEETKKLYGLDNAATQVAGQRLLAARRLVERGVRFVQVYPTPYGTWDSHQKLRENHARQSAVVDKPIAGLLTDLKQR